MALLTGIIYTLPDITVVKHTKKYDAQAKDPRMRSMWDTLLSN